MSADRDNAAIGIGVIGLDHVQLAMPPRGERDARRFYADILGLREVDKPAALAGRGGCWFVGPGGTAIHLGVDERFMAAKKGHPCLIVADLAAARRALADAHVAIEDDAAPDVDRCYISDPFGNRIELVDVGDAGFTNRRPPG
jgi:catechol 2,3-dioxygenase-like lactoylglutathione lyase family enzyme